MIVQYKNFSITLRFNRNNSFVTIWLITAHVFASNHLICNLGTEDSQERIYYLNGAS